MPEVITIKDLAGPERRQVDALKKSVSDIADKLSLVRESARDVAPKVMQLFRDLAAKYENLGGFIGFVRLFDATVPDHAGDKDGVEGYRKHKTYYAMDYMRRLVNLRPRGRQGVRDPATDQLARVLATVLQVVADAGPIWTAVAREFGLKDRGVARLKTRVEAAKPLIDLSGVIRKPVSVDESKIVHMEPIRAAAKAAAVPPMEQLRAAAAALNQPGRRVRRAAAPAA